MGAEVRPVSSGVDRHFTHEQPIASGTWTIVHNLAKYPSVQIVDLNDEAVLAQVSYPDINTVVITLNNALAGRAFLN
jgi:hypothetical protein